MKCRTRKTMTKVQNRKRGAISSKKIDPTQTAGLRRKLLAEIRKRFAILRGRIVKFVVVEDAFGMTEKKPLLNVERIEMPQIRKEHWQEFLSYVKKQTSLTEESGVEPKSLRAVQSEFSQERADSIPLEKLQWPILISQDGYVLDGNHRWIKAYQAGHPLKVLRLGLDKNGALELMRDFCKAQFVENCGGEGGIPGPCPTLSQKAIGIIRGKYAKFSERYGKRGAVAIMAAMAVTMPLPGNILAVIGAAEGIRAASKLLGNKQYEVVNVFCPTGPGGGQDNSCSPTSSAAHERLAKLAKGRDVISIQESGISVLSSSPFGEIETASNLDFDKALVKELNPNYVYSYGDVDELSVRGIAQHIDGPEKPIDVVRWKGRDYVVDGHHRIVAAKLKDPSMNPKIKARFIDLQPKLPMFGKRVRNSTFDDLLTDVRELYNELRGEVRPTSRREFDADAFTREYVKQVGKPTTNAGRFQFHSTPEKIKAFQDWLREQYKDTLTGKSEEELWKRFAMEGYRKGAGRAWDDVKGAEFKKTHPELYTKDRQESVKSFYQGTREEFLRSSFGRPETAEKLQLLASRSYSDLANVTDDMAVRMGRTLMDGLARGANPREIGQLLDDELDIGENRAEMIARTEIVRAHAEGQLDSMEAMGVEEVGVAVEWSTAGDLRVCRACDSLISVVLKTRESHGLIPRHPQCRCAWLPWLGEDTKDTKRTKAEIEDAIQESLDAEAEGRKEGFETTWVGADLEVDEDRPTGILGETTKNQQQIWEAIASHEEST